MNLLKTKHFFFCGLSHGGVLRKPRRLGARRANYVPAFMIYYYY